VSTAINEKLRTFIEELHHEAVDDVAAGSGQGNARTTAPPPPPPPVRKHPDVQRHPVSTRPSKQQWITLYSRIATVLIVLLLVATGIVYYLHRAERAAIASRIDAIVRAPLVAPLEGQLLELEKQLVANRRTNEIRLQAFEQQLTDNQQAYRQQLQDMEQRLVQLHEPQEQRLQQVEQRLARLQQTDGKRVQAIENRLDLVTARMDGWAAVVADLSVDDQSVSPLHAATVAEPPAKRAIEPVVVARNNVVLLPAKSIQVATQDKPPMAAAAATTPGAQGDWVINIGSYMREKIAARQMAEFRKQGVSAELVTATVRGKTIYRVQVAGFVSMAEARDHASQVRETLGLKETWIRRR
jgi:cell division septation protein DedD